MTRHECGRYLQLKWRCHSPHHRQVNHKFSDALSITTSIKQHMNLYLYLHRQAPTLKIMYKIAVTSAVMLIFTCIIKTVNMLSTHSSINVGYMDTPYHHWGTQTLILATHHMWLQQASLICCRFQHNKLIYKTGVCLLVMKTHHEHYISFTSLPMHVAPHFPQSAISVCMYSGYALTQVAYTLFLQC